MKSVYVVSLRTEDGATQMTKALRIQDLRLPIHICLGRYEAATQEELDELITDLTHETDRRAAARAA